MKIPPASIVRAVAAWFLIGAAQAGEVNPGNLSVAPRRDSVELLGRHAADLMKTSSKPPELTKLTKFPEITHQTVFGSSANFSAIIAGPNSNALPTYVFSGASANFVATVSAVGGPNNLKPLELYVHTGGILSAQQ